MLGVGKHLLSGRERLTKARSKSNRRRLVRRASLTEVVRGFGVMAAATLLGQLIGFLVLAIAARRLGAENIGHWYLTVSLTAILSLPAGLGMTLLGTRDIARDPSSAKRVVAEVLVIQGFLAVMMVVVLIVLLRPAIAGDNALLSNLIIIGSFAIIANALVLEWALLALARTGWVAWWRLAGQLVYGVLGVTLITAGAVGTQRYGAINMVGLGVTTVGTWLSVLAFVGLPRSRLSIRRLLRRVRRSLPFGAILAMMQVYWALGLLLLGIIGSTRDAGLYGVAQRLPQVLVTLVALWMSTMYPHSAALYRTAPDELARQIRVVLGAGLTVLLPIVLTAPFVGADLMAAFFGAEYREAGAPFAWLVLVAVMIFVSVTFSSVLLAVGAERRLVAYVALGAAVALSLNVALIPRVGAIAPALATLAAETVVAGLCARKLSRRLGSLLPAIPNPGRLALACLLCLSFLAVTGSVLWQVQATMGVLLYVIASGAFSFRQWPPRLSVQGVRE